MNTCTVYTIIMLPTILQKNSTLNFFLFYVTFLLYFLERCSGSEKTLQYNMARMKIVIQQVRIQAKKYV